MGTDYLHKSENGQAPVLQGAGALSLSMPEMKHLPFYTMKVEIQALIRRLSEVFQIDVDFCTTTVYAAVAAVMGNRFTTRDPKGYINSLAIWLCHVAVSGYGKSPVEDAVMQPLIDRQEAFRLEYKEKMKEWEKSKEGAKPKRRKVFVSDSTPEALYQALEDNQEGLLLYREELSGWPQDFGRYNASGEIDILLSIFSGKSVDTTRITREGNFVRRPCLSVFGGTQPDRLAKVFGREIFLTSGFDARLLWVYPDVQIDLKYKTAAITKDYLDEWNNFVMKLYSLEPRQVTFSTEAQRLYIDYWESLQEKKAQGDSYMQQIYSKLQIYCEKWAGLTFLLSEQNYQADYALTEIDAQSMQIAIESMGIFEEWAAKVYAKMCDSSPSMHMTKAQLIQKLNEMYPIKNIQQFADSIGVSRPLISRALNQGKGKTETDVTVENSQKSDI